MTISVTHADELSSGEAKFANDLSAQFCDLWGTIF